MAKTLSTVVEDVQDLLTKGLSEEVSKDVVMSFATRLTNLLLERLKPREPRPPRLYMSMLGDPLKRIFWYMRGVKRPDPDAADKLKFLYGDLVEELLLLLVELSGHEVTDRQKRVSIKGVNGYIDCKIDGVTVDTKSASSFGFKKFEDNTLAKDDPFGYLYQIGSYMQAQGETKGAFLAVDKESGKLCLTQVDVSETPNIADRIDEINNTLSTGELPDSEDCRLETEANGNITLAGGCRYCHCKTKCHPNLRAFKYSNGTKYYTHVEKLPRVEEINLNEVVHTP